MSTRGCPLPSCTHAAPLHGQTQCAERSLLVADAHCDVCQEEQERNRRILAALEGEKSDLASRHQQLTAQLDQTKVGSAAGHLAGKHPLMGLQRSAAE